MNYKEALSITKNCPKCCSGRMERLLAQKSKQESNTVKKDNEPKKQEQ